MVDVLEYSIRVYIVNTDSGPSDAPGRCRGFPSVRSPPPAVCLLLISEMSRAHTVISTSERTAPARDHLLPVLKAQ
jgi:hypothetical protein